MRQSAETILRAFAEANIKLDPSSRIAKQVDTYLDRKGVLPQIVEPTHEIFPTIVEAQRDLAQIAFAIAQLQPVIPKAEMAKRLRTIARDPTLPQDSRESSFGRDAQCELFVAALCARAAMKPIFNESPDIRCEVNGGIWGVAVKRIKTPRPKFDDRLKERIGDATKQIQTSGLPGVIALDIAQALNPTNWWVPLEVSDLQFDAAWNRQMDALKEQFADRFYEWTRGTPARGIVFIDHVLRSLPQNRWRLELFLSSFNLARHNQRRHREFQTFDVRLKWAGQNSGGLSS